MQNVGFSQCNTNRFAMQTKEGFELVAFIGDNITFNNNFDSMSDDERIIKYNFSLTVPGYILNSKLPGLANQMRSYTSAPMIDFSYNSVNAKVSLDFQPDSEQQELEKHVLSDVTNKEESELRRGESNETIEAFVTNPFSNEDDTEFLRITNSNKRTGETVVSARIIKEIDRQYE